MSNYFKNFDGAESADINLDTIQDFVNAEGMNGGLVRNEGQHRESFKMQSGMGLLDAENYQIGSLLPEDFGTGGGGLSTPSLPSSTGATNSMALCSDASFAARYPNLCRITTEQYGTANTTNTQRGQGLSRFAQGLQRGLGILNQNQNPNLQQGGVFGQVFGANNQVQPNAVLPCQQHGFVGCQSMGTSATCQTQCTTRGGGNWVIPVTIGLIGLGVVFFAMNATKDKTMVISSGQPAPKATTSKS